jgi:hypothetical protein
MNESELRALAIAALERAEAARSGRMRTETINRLGGRFDAENERSSSDLIFDHDLPASSSRLETSAGPDYHSMVETIAFPGRGRFYARVIEVGELGRSAADYPDGVIPAEFDDTRSPEAELWSVVSPEQHGMSLAEFLHPTDGIWLRDLLADPSQKLRLIEAREDRVTADFVIRGDQFGGVGTTDTIKAQTSSLTPDAAITVRLVIAGPNLERLTFVLPPDANGDAALIETSFWRMGEPVSIVEPDSSECRPAPEPVRTTIAALEPVSAQRWLTFKLDGSDQSAMCPWSEGDSSEPYAPLAVGDHLRVWGSTRRPPPLPIGASFDLWAVATTDGTMLFDRRPDEDSSIWRKRFYAAAVDVIEREVVLTGLKIELKRLRLSFTDLIVAEVAEVYLDQADGSDLAGPAVGEPVVVRTAHYGRATVIVRVERAGGTPIYDLVGGTGWQAVAGR